MSGDNRDDDKGFTDGTLFDMQATSEDDDLDKTGAWIPIQQEEEVDEGEPADDSGKTAVLSLDDVMEAERRSSSAGTGESRSDRREKMEPEMESEPESEPEPVEPKSDEVEPEETEKTFVLDLSAGVDEPEEDTPEPEEEKTVAIPAVIEELDASEEKTVMFQVPVVENPVRARLIGVDGPDAGGEWELKEDEVVLGRSKDCDLSVKDPTSSRKHVKLTWTGETYSFLDMGSGNGTTINGTRQGAGDLGHGDVLGLGQSTLRFELDRAPAMPVSKNEAPPPREEPVVETSKGAAASADKKGLLPAVIGLGVVVVALLAYLLLGGGEDEKEVVQKPPAESMAEKPSGETLYEDGLKFAREKNWEEAVNTLQRAANSDPKNDQFQKALRRAEEELNNQERFETAVAKEKEGKLWGAIAQLRKISASSDFSAEAKMKLEKLEMQFETQQITVLEGAIREGRMDDAREEVEELGQNLPDSEVVKAFAEAIRGGKGSARRFLKRRGQGVKSASSSADKKSSKAAPAKGAPKKAAASVPSPPKKKSEPVSAGKGKDSGLVAKAKGFYRSKNLAGAVGILSKAMESGKGSPDVARLLSDLQSFKGAYEKAQTASGSARLKALERAYKKDKKLGGAFASSIGPGLADSYGKKAAADYANELFAPAAKAAKKALSYDKDNMNAAGVLKKCQAKGEAFFQQGITAFENGQNGVARTFLKLAADILPKGSSKHKKAKQALDAL